MSAESLPIVCGYCRRPLRYVKRVGLLDVASNRRHFYMGHTCLFVTTEMAQRIDRVRRR